ncbi:MAG: hypothetical protein COX65_05720 [Elusimicrobia bacterium CG_4_10_14_0_2_um_filter_56_8]|nr:MAG: hypothetical protein AUJ51_05870 [Elusimicrobia bacterium CG1_02_56_21]PJA14375.1 MAG: hypothetical protein COX65_05720 [Elusimicrobia bacterium CG_4_10_14_0_2_um_filter_56_8]
MPISAYILIAAALHLGAFVAYPQSGRFAFPFLAVSMILWAGFSIFINRAANQYGKAWKTAIAVIFALACAFSSLSFLPQKDGISALHKLMAGKYPDRNNLFFGLARLGIYAPGLLPAKKQETLP